jgi:hypothetical protein
MSATAATARTARRNSGNRQEFLNSVDLPRHSTAVTLAKTPLLWIPVMLSALRATRYRTFESQIEK